ncbi:MAG: hypothetical protein ACJ79H_07360 [Myxococcales bacterium]
MAKIVFAQTNSRTILGTMNDFDRMLDPAAGQSLTSAALELAEAPLRPDRDGESESRYGEPVRESAS